MVGMMNLYSERTEKSTRRRFKNFRNPVPNNQAPRSIEIVQCAGDNRHPAEHRSATTPKIPKKLESVRMRGREYRSFAPSRKPVFFEKTEALPSSAKLFTPRTRNTSQYYEKCGKLELERMVAGGRFELPTLGLCEPFPFVTC
jgi:hypothetical protein